MLNCETEVIFDSCWEKLPLLLKGKRTFFVVDKNVHTIYRSFCAQNDVFVFEGGENNKNLKTVSEIFEFLLSRGADRKSFLVAIGGGITTDTAAFAASTYMRGIPFALVPTTLLSQVDASYGAKNGVNFQGLKNIIGSFTQPEFSLIDVSLLSTLSFEEFLSGLAEVVKSAIIMDGELFAFLEGRTPEQIFSSLEDTSYIVRSSLDVKRRIVREDPLECSLRRVLNLGHTLAHAIEKACQPFCHGIAVAIGMKYVLRIAKKKNMISTRDAERISNLLERYFPMQLPCRVKDVVEAFSFDKKKNGDKIHLIVPTAVGHVEQLEMNIDELKKIYLDVE
ncbi:MAG: 3-dehydroquinate synthase [Alistipes sp.]|nr:3-dehydroquinate synthase [Candidatus Alistipes equi]